MVVLLLWAADQQPPNDSRHQLYASFRRILTRNRWTANGKPSRAPELLEMNSRARALAEKIGDLPQVVQQLHAAALYAIARGDYFAEAALAAQALEVAQREGSPISLGLGHAISLEARFYLGDFVGAEDHFARGRGFVEAPGFLQIGALALPLVVATFGPGSWNAFFR